MHIVHLNEAVTRAQVLGFFFNVEEGAPDNEFLASFPFATAVDADGKVALGDVNVAEFLKSVDMTKYFYYQGSLTTPPCSEIVEWTFVDQVLPMSQAQLDAWKAQ